MPSSGTTPRPRKAADAGLRDWACSLHDVVEASVDPFRNPIPGQAVTAESLNPNVTRASALRSARLPVNLIGSPIDYANRLIGSPITTQSSDSCYACSVTLASTCCGRYTERLCTVLISMAGRQGQGSVLWRD